MCMKSVTYREYEIEENAAMYRVYSCMYVRAMSENLVIDPLSGIVSRAGGMDLVILR